MVRLIVAFLSGLLFFTTLLSASENEIIPDYSRAYEIITKGGLEELRDESVKRGLPSEGDESILRSRILNDELSKTLIPFEERIKDIKTEDIVLDHADFVEYRKDEIGEEHIWLNGDVQVLLGEKKIHADELKINISAGLVTGDGNVTFIDGPKTYLAERFFYDTSNDEALFFSGRTTLGKFFYSGKVIRKVHESEKFVADEVSLTTCGLKNPHYRVEAQRLFYYDEKRVLIKDASFYYGSEALFKLPYFYRNLEKPEIKSAIFFRERSGLIVQNTYYPIKTETRELVLKGDFYERLGTYTGVGYRDNYSKGETRVDLSTALSKDMYFYNSVTGNWSPLGPPGSETYGIDRSFRYRFDIYQKLNWGYRVENTSEINLSWIKDPYYEYDFERRIERFDPFDLIGQAEEDSPRRGGGFTWYLNNNSYLDSLSLSLQNSARFEPQRNTDVDTVSLPDYYEYRIYRITAPGIILSHQKNILSDIKPDFLSNMEYKSSAAYSNTMFYDENGIPSSQVHQAMVNVNLKKSYTVTEYLEINPEVEVGVQGQGHVDPDESELSEDRKNSMLYGRTREALLFGENSRYVELIHNLKYKLLGPDDYYEFGDFRMHDIGFKGYMEFWKIEDQLTLQYDLRPTYDWDEGNYEPFILNMSKFSPLINTLSFRPFSYLTIDDRLVYDIPKLRFSMNSFVLNYLIGDVYLKDRRFSLSWILSWQHNFINPLIDVLRSDLDLNVQVHKFWTLYFSVFSSNDNLWKYFRKTAQERGIEPVNPVVDLLKSYNFFNRKDREESQFKMKSISFGFFHDLHDWELRFDYRGGRELSYDGSRYVWNNTYSVSLGLKDIEDLNIHTRFAKKR